MDEHKKFYYGAPGTPPVAIPVGTYEIDEITDN